MTDSDSNPFFDRSSLDLQFPPFDEIKVCHYVLAFERGMKEQELEIEAIAKNRETATFENTLVALEKSGQILTRVKQVFFAMISAHTNDELEDIHSQMAPKLSAHRDAIYLNRALFLRIEFLYKHVETLDLDSESRYLIEETHRHFVRAGAKLSSEDKEKIKAINAELASLQTQFDQNVLNEVNDKAFVVDREEDLAGLSEQALATAAEAAKARGLEGKFVLALLNTSSQPALSSLTKRELRQRIEAVSLGRGSSGGDYDNREILSRIVRLRAEHALLQGYDNHAAYVLDGQTAKTTSAVNERLTGLAKAAVSNAKREAADLQAMIDAEGGDFTLASWDWGFYAEKVRQNRYEFDESQLKPYLELNNVLEKGVFFAAEKLFGVSFHLRTDLPVYHPDVRVWEIKEADGARLALFVEDMFARSSKSGGAWMNDYVAQSRLMGSKAVVGNHLNIPKPPEGEPALLTWDEVIALFHEFGHALHGIFSDVKFPSFSGTSVPTDFVEFPSQVNEMWADWPEVLANYAVHYQTGEPMPSELLSKVLASVKFNQGFATTEYLSASLLDQALHQLKPDEVPSAGDLLQFEAEALSAAKVDLDEVPPRYRSTYFSHISGGYSAGYYSYIWSEVLDADSVEWFKDNGGLCHKNGEYFREKILSRGGSADAMGLYRSFRGTEPDIQALLDRRGLN